MRKSWCLLTSSSQIPLLLLVRPEKTGYRPQIESESPLELLVAVQQTHLQLLVAVQPTHLQLLVAVRRSGYSY